MTGFVGAELEAAAADPEVKTGRGWAGAAVTGGLKPAGTGKDAALILAGEFADWDVAAEFAEVAVVFVERRRLLDWAIAIGGFVATGWVGAVFTGAGCFAIVGDTTLPIGGGTGIATASPLDWIGFAEIGAS